ncbi:MAG: DUF2961 domain-containing protein [Segetibacter sp.]|jgi:hypothetical protein|nr:DUF2961 domain-containing protein [Segetibacter sp.]
MKLFVLFLIISCSVEAQELYKVPANIQTGWSSFENPTAGKGKGGWENKGAKGHASEHLKPGESKVLLNIQGAGIIERIWITIKDRSPIMLRSIRIDIYWDGSEKPAVSAPLGDFFGIGLGRTTRFENALFSNPEGRSFNCNIPMPFRKAARIVLTNDTNRDEVLFYDINFIKVNQHNAEVLYFHAFWNSNNRTKLGEDFEILPALKGKGRFIGCNLGIIADSSYGKSWWGEGEVKIYLDGDGKLPTLVGTGTEDYIGTAWGQHAFIHTYQGCPIEDTANRQWAFYRYHIPDPVYFSKDCRVAIQQMGGDTRDNVRRIAAAGAQLIPVTVSTNDSTILLLDLNPAPKLTDTDFPSGWTNFYRLDNYSSTAYFYLDKPANNLPPLQELKVRTKGIADKQIK